MPQQHSEPAEPPSGRRRVFRPHELVLADGDRLVLDAAGSITRMAPDGTERQRWAQDDPEWPRHAIRFGLRVPASTANPHGRTIRQDQLPRR